MSDIILDMRHITKEFPGVRALDDVNFEVERGSIHALVGENGAGKSTLMNVLSGVLPYGSYTGDIVYNGEVCKFTNLRDSESKGIVIIHQELALIQDLTIGENMFLGNERGKPFAIDWDETYAEANRYLEIAGLRESSQALIRNLGVGKQQLVEFAKALSKNAKLLILDEPTSSLNDSESKALLDLLLRLKEEGMTSIIISHKLDEVSYVADDITILRDGKTVETLHKGQDEIDENRIIRGMVGRELSERFPVREAYELGSVTLETHGWTVHDPSNLEKIVVNNVSFNVRSGEVVGIAGLMGSGRTELAMSIFGHSYGANISGSLEINGEEVPLHSVGQAIEHGLAYVTEDRKGNGLILSGTIKMNTTLANLDGVAERGIIDSDKEYAVAEDYRQKLRTRSNSVEQLVRNLSGGNQQKVLISKWMFADPDILILDEPTRGIDVGAKFEIYNIINQLAAEGKSIVFISSEMPEILGMSDRIYVMNEGHIVGEFDRDDASQESIMGAILRSSNNQKGALKNG